MRQALRLLLFIGVLLPIVSYGQTINMTGGTQTVTGTPSTNGAGTGTPNLSVTFTCTGAQNTDSLSINAYVGSTGVTNSVSAGTGTVSINTSTLPVGTNTVECHDSTAATFVGFFYTVSADPNRSSVSIVDIQDPDGTPLNGTVCFTPVNNYGQIIAYSDAGGAAIRPVPACRTITNGALSTILLLPRSNMTIPVGVTYNIYFSDKVTNDHENYGTYDITGDTWSLDDAAPSNVQTAPPAAWVPTISVGSVTSLPAGSTPVVTDTGSQLGHIFNFEIPRGVQGAQGQVGPIGPQGSPGPATVAIGSVTTAVAGSSATVTNVGTQSAAVLDFTIPQGAPGTMAAVGAYGTLQMSNGLGQNGAAVDGINYLSPATGTAYNGSGTHNYIGVNLFGDSTCASVGATNYTSGWCSLIGSAIGNAHNYAVAGDEAEDTAFTHVYPNMNPQLQGNNVAVLEDGINDANLCGSTAGCEANFSHAFLASLSWMAIPNSSKILFGSNTQSVTTTGTWTPDSTMQANLGLQTTTGGTLTFTTFIPSQVLYLTWMAKDGDAAYAALSCDSGAVSDTLEASGFNGQAIATQNGDTETPFTTRYVFPTSGIHSCSVSATASTGNPFSLVWAATVAPTDGSGYGAPGTNPPAVYVSGVIHQQGGTKDSTTALYNTLVQNLVSEVAQDGWLAYFVDARDAVNDTTDMACSATILPNGITVPASTNCGLHPNGNGSVGGHTDWANAFLRQMMPLSTANFVVNQVIPGGSYTASCTDAAIYMTNGTLTLPNSCAAGKMIAIVYSYNYGPVTIAGTLGLNMPTSLTLGSSLIAEYGGPGVGWFSMTSAATAASANSLVVYQAVQGAGYTPSCANDYLIYANQTETVTLPSTCSVGKVFKVLNSSVAGTVTIASSLTMSYIPSALAVGQSVEVEYEGGAGWFATGGASTNAPLPEAQTVQGASYTASCVSDKVVYMSGGGTLTLPTTGCAAGKFIYAFNGSTSATLAIAGANSYAPTSIAPLSGVTFEYEGGGGWYPFSFYNHVSSTSPSIRAGSVTITSSTTATVTFATAMSVAPTSCVLNPQASSATTGQPYATNFTTTGFTANVPTSGTLVMTYQCVVNNGN